jgi:hypothetical protein
MVVGARPPMVLTVGVGPVVAPRRGTPRVDRSHWHPHPSHRPSHRPSRAPGRAPRCVHNSRRLPQVDRDRSLRRHRRTDRRPHHDDLPRRTRPNHRATTRDTSHHMEANKPSGFRRAEGLTQNSRNLGRPPMPRTHTDGRKRRRRSRTRGRLTSSGDHRKGDHPDHRTYQKECHASCSMPYRQVEV